MKTYSTVAVETDINGIDSNEELIALFTRAMEICQTTKASQGISCSSSSSTQYLSFPDITYCVQYADSVDLQPVPLPDIDFQEVLDSVRANFTQVTQEVEMEEIEAVDIDDDSVTIRLNELESTSHLNKHVTTYSTTHEEASSVLSENVVDVQNERNKVLKMEYSKMYTSQEPFEKDVTNPDNGTLDLPVKKYSKRQRICPHCDKVFLNFSTLRNHIKAQHNSSKKRPHQCQYCGMKFIHAGNLIWHTKTHFEIERFKCSMCDKSFRFTTCLSRHSRSHQQEKPHKCEFCEEEFVKVEDLVEHLTKTHTGERPYKCELCDKAFMRKCKLDVHLKTH